MFIQRGADRGDSVIPQTRTQGTTKLTRYTLFFVVFGMKRTNNRKEASSRLSWLHLAGGYELELAHQRKEEHIEYELFETESLVAYVLLLDYELEHKIEARLNSNGERHPNKPKESDFLCLNSFVTPAGKRKSEDLNEGTSKKHKNAE